MWKTGDIFKDIVDDYSISEQRMEGRRGASFWIMLLPQIIGFVCGLAFARFFHLDGSAYIPIGAIIALIIGTYKSVSYDKFHLYLQLSETSYLCLYSAQCLGLQV